MGPLDIPVRAPYLLVEWGAARQTPGAMSTKVDCRRCVFFRSAPYQAKHEGCYHPDLMKSKQKDSYLDEQQLPGDFEAINRLGDCEQFQARAQQPSLWRRMFSIGA